MGSQMPPEDELDRFSEFRMPHVIKRCTEDTGSTGGFKKCRADPIEDVMQYRYILYIVCVRLSIYSFILLFWGHIFAKCGPYFEGMNEGSMFRNSHVFFAFVFFGKNIPCLETTSPLELAKHEVGMISQPGIRTHHSSTHSSTDLPNNR